MTKVLIYVAILAGLLGAGAWYGSSRYEAGRNDLLADQAKQAETDRQKSDMQTVASDAGAAKAKSEGEQAQAASVENTRTVVQTVTRIIHDSPSPSVCVVPPDSVRELTSAIGRANAAAGRVSGAQPGRDTSTDVH
ncbi:MAG: hypothetical protein AAGC76_09370 [Luteibacter sp.]|uniref:hypothetical protein n=1 Tax=Luteibacter sp. TaxID=1886636 RepID=UPI0028090344|nr:hypothetical protein [Luteibacter sp.]MDQ7996051.1 hypothetical protein [Luteibacter sp.]